MQTITERYKEMRRAGFPAALALANCRTAGSTPYYHRSGYVNRAFPRRSLFGRHYADRGYRWVENVSRLNWRLVGFADNIIGLKHQGWFTNEFCDDVYRGIVYRLPSGRFVYGYADPHNDDCALIANETADDEKDAARWADNVAQWFAEDERDYSEVSNTTFRAIERANDARKDAREALEDVRSLETCDSPRIQKRVRSAFVGAWEAYRDAMSALADALARAKPYQISYRDF
jgi:hypothetical protein